MNDKVYLAGLGLGSLTTGIMLLAPGICFSYVLGTVMAQSAGAGDHRFCKVLLNRQYFLNTLIYLVIIIPVFFIKEIYVAIGQEPEVAELASTYIWYVMPGVFFFMQATSAVKAAESLKYTSAMFVSSSIASIFHLIMVYVFIEVYDWGFEGIAIATSIHLFIRFLASQAYLLTVTELQAVKDVSFFSSETFENLGY